MIKTNMLHIYNFYDFINQNIRLCNIFIIKYTKQKNLFLMK
jgi:hypothetical protein